MTTWELHKKNQKNFGTHMGGGRCARDPPGSEDRRRSGGDASIDQSFLLLFVHKKKALSP